MSKSLLQTRIIDKLEVILTQVDTMNKFGKNIPLIHLDILKSNVRTLYEQICELERSQMQTSTVHQTVRPVSREIITENVKEEEIVEHARQTISEIVDSIQEEINTEFATEIPINFAEETSPLAPIIEAKKENPIIHTTPEIELPLVTEDTSIQKQEPEIVPEIPVENEIKFETTVEIKAEAKEASIEFSETVKETVIESNHNDPIPDIFSSLQTIADRYKTPESSLNETLSMSGVTTINSAVKQIRDLKSAIGINEKFLFINDLFKGNMKEYTDTIIALNETENMDTAMILLQPIREKYNWHEDTMAYTTLIDFLKRRFI